jgi:hypothetical protein
MNLIGIKINEIVVGRVSFEPKNVNTLKNFEKIGPSDQKSFCDLLNRPILFRINAENVRIYSESYFFRLL